MSASKSFNLQAIITAVDKISGPIKGINKNLRGLHHSMDKLGQAGDTLRNNLGIPAALLGGSVVGAVVESTKKFMEFSNQVESNSKKLGISAEKLQEWNYVAGKNDVQADEMQSSMAKLNRVIFEAASGKNASALSLFNRLGISLRDNNGHLKTSGDILPQVSDGFHNNTNAVVRAAMAQELFGKAGDGMINTLSQGSDSINQQIASAHKLNLIMSDSQIAEGSSFGSTTWKDLNDQINALTLSIGSTLIPVIKPLIEAFTQWVSANRVLIQQRVHEVVTKIADGLRNVNWTAIGKGIEKIWNGMEAMANAMGGWDNFMVALLVISQASTIMALINIGEAIWGIGAALAGLAGGFPQLTILIATFTAAYAIGKKLAGVIDSIVSKFSGGDSLGTWIYNKTHDDSGITASSGNPSVLSAANGRQTMNGSMDVNFNNAPAGMRVVPGATSPGFDFNPNVGYNYAAAGGW
jgi:hypothetical protein